MTAPHKEMHIVAMKYDLDRKHNWRLNFHLQTPIGWLSDPNGLCQFDGTYHIFHQYSPRWPYNAHGWGHWASPDLITWEFLGGAILPDMPLDKNGSYSGSAVIRDGEMWCYYTGNVLEAGDHDYDYSGRHANEMLVTSADGRTFGEKRLVLSDAAHPAYCSNHVRDPKVWEQDGRWHMLLGCRTMDDHGALLLFCSDDGISWEMEGSCTGASGKPFGYMWECPNVVTLDGREFLFVCPQGTPKQDFSLQNIYNSGYFPIDGRVIDLMGADPGLAEAEGPYPCIDESTFVELDYGFDFYAPQIFTDEQGRAILVGWVGLPDIDTQYDVPTREWSHTLTMPRELSLNGAGRICQRPVAEMEALRGDEVPFSAEAARGSTGTIGSSSYDMFSMEGAVGMRAGGTADVEIRGIQGEGRLMINGDLELMVHGDTCELAFLSPAGRFRSVRRLPLAHLSAGRIESIRAVIDTSLVEFYLNDGEVTLTTRFFPLDIDRLCVTSTFAAESCRAWEMGSFTFKNCG